MSTVRWHVTMSLDGFIAGPKHEMEWATVPWLPRMTEMPPLARTVLEDTGAIVAGRGWYEAARDLHGVDGIYGGEWDGVVLVLTHHADETPYDPRITFVTSGITDAVERAQAAAGDQGVVVFGADLARQALDANLVDEIVVHVAPVLLGDGIRLQGTKQIGLEPITLGSTGHLADLHYRVLRESDVD